MICKAGWHQQPICFQGKQLRCSGCDDAFVTLFWCISVNYQEGSALGKIRSITRDSVKADLRAKHQYRSTIPLLQHIFVPVFKQRTLSSIRRTTLKEGLLSPLRATNTTVTLSKIALSCLTSSESSECLCHSTSREIR